MLRRVTAAAVVAILLTLTGIAFLQDVGLIKYSTTEMDRSIEDVLDNFEEAVRTPEHLPDVSLSSWSYNPYPFFVALPQDSFLRNGFTAWTAQETKFSIQDFKPHKFYQIFLI